MKKISVIIPCYNVEHYIKKCIDSILENTYKKLEIILINDGSFDKTGSIIDEYKLMDDRIIIVHQNNKGLSATRNLGLTMSTGKYITFIDSDDWIESNYFETLINNIDDETDLVLCSYTRRFNNISEPRILNLQGKIPSLFIKRRLIGLIDHELNDPSQADSLVTVWAKLYKSSIIKQNKIEFTDVNKIGTAEDLVFNLNYLFFSKGISKVLDMALYNYRKDNTTSFTTKYKYDLFSKWLFLFDIIKNYITTSEEKSAFQNRIALSIIGLGLNELGNPLGRKQIVDNLKIILDSKEYIAAYKNLEFKYFPLHWKVFFWSAKKKKVNLLYFLLLTINFLIYKKNK